MKILRFCGDVWSPPSSRIRFQDDLAGLVINLEAPITAAEVCVRDKICLRQDPNVLSKAFRRMPVAACLANNHLFDYGYQGFKDTVLALDEAGVRYFGAGARERNYGNPLIINVDSTSVALMGYVCSSTHPAPDANDIGTAPLELARITKDVKLARELGATRLVVTLHWGDEEVWIPKATDIEIAAALVELGVDLIIGHHAHTQQPVYVSERGQHVFFGVGNAIFPDFEYWQDGSLFAWSKQRFWNRKSALVTYAPGSNSIQWSTLKQAGNHVVSERRAGLRVWSELPRQPGYRTTYEGVRKRAMLRLAASKALAKPRMPTLKHLRLLSRLVLQRVNRSTSGVDR